jgi:hypothetical protein
MLASRVVTSRMLRIEPPLASYLNPKSLVGFLLLTLKHQKLKARVSTVDHHCREGELPSVSTTFRDSTRVARRSVLAGLHSLF